MNKPGWLKDSIAKSNGYFSPRGDHLKSAKLTQEQIDAWNGTPAPAPAPEPEVEEVVEETAPAVEVTTVEVEAAPKKKKFFGKKK